MESLKFLVLYARASAVATSHSSTLAWIDRHDNRSLFVTHVVSETCLTRFFSSTSFFFNQNFGVYFLVFPIARLSGALTTALLHMQGPHQSTQHRESQQLARLHQARTDSQFESSKQVSTSKYTADLSSTQEIAQSCHVDFARPLGLNVNIPSRTKVNLVHIETVKLQSQPSGNAKSHDSVFHTDTSRSSPG